METNIIIRFLNYARNVFNPVEPVEVDSKNVRRIMYTYFMLSDWKYCTSITKIVTKECPTYGLVIEIETHKPGVLIGKAGQYIDAMKEFLIKELNREDVTIKLTECKMWYGIYL